MVSSDIRVLGKPPLARDAQGRLYSRIATVFPRSRTLVTLPGIHCTQRQAFVDDLNQARSAAGQQPLSEQEEAAAWDEGVDLIIEGDTILIRPDPNNMPLAFQADDVLQRLVSKRQINYLFLFNEQVRTAIKARGECWRIAPLPTSRAEMRQRIVASRIAIGGREIYYYNPASGTRYLTCQELDGLGRMDAAELRRHLREIQQHCKSYNAQGHPEVAFFLADDSLTSADWSEHDFAAMDDRQLRAVHQELCDCFQAAVPAEFARDDIENNAWRNRLFSALVMESDREVIAEETLLGLSPEFFMQIRWLPGGRLVNGELMFDEVFEEEGNGATPVACDPNVREFLYNLVREHDDLEYVNIGRVVNSLSRRPQSRGRRDVYIAVMKQSGFADEMVSILRMQKWGVREHLNRGVSLSQAMWESDDYTQYLLDRRTGCSHLGMNIPRRTIARKICERYTAAWTGPDGMMIWSPYFERAYIAGIATDKMPRQRFDDDAFAAQFARLLGQAAAPNLIVGRCDDVLENVMFDDGDEVVLEDDQGQPTTIIVTDQTGTFGNYRSPLQLSAAAYAGPVNRRLEFLRNPEEFARLYLEGFVEHFAAIQEKLQRRRRAFFTMFQNRRYDPKGSFAYRWEEVLKRLSQADPRELADLIRANLAVSVVC
jgi:hypothetical protein